MIRINQFFKSFKSYVVFLLFISITIFLIPSFEEVIASDHVIKIYSEDNKSSDNDDNLIVKSKIHLEKIEKIGFIRIIGFINAQEFSQDVSLSTISSSTDKLIVKFIVDKKNEIVEADSPDEFFICAYHIKNPYSTIIDYFDCNEGDLQSDSGVTRLNLFKPSSQVHHHSTDFYNSYKNKNGKVSSGNYKKNQDVDILNELSKQEKVKVKIIVPLKDKKNTDKIKISAMLKGQIQSEVIDVEKEFDEIDGYTIKRTFEFNRNTDIGIIQIGDKFHGCVSGEDLRPPEGTECEKRLIKSLQKSNKLIVR